jgi:hypothetical protein
MREMCDLWWLPWLWRWLCALSQATECIANLTKLLPSEARLLGGFNSSGCRTLTVRAFMHAGDTEPGCSQLLAAPLLCYIHALRSTLRLTVSGARGGGG